MFDSESDNQCIFMKNVSFTSLQSICVYLFFLLDQPALYKRIDAFPRFGFGADPRHPMRALRKHISLRTKLHKKAQADVTGDSPTKR